MRDTKVLEVSAKLGDPKVAQALAQYIAEETVSMSHRESLASDHDFADLADKQVTEAQRRLDDAQSAWNALAAREPVESLQSEIDADVRLRGKVEEQLVDRANRKRPNTSSRRRMDLSRASNGALRRRAPLFSKTFA